jgi:hypothetical protein
MQHVKKIIISLLTALLIVPIYSAMALADVNEEGNGRAYLILAFPNSVPTSEVKNSALIDLRSKKAFSENPTLKGATNMNYRDALKALERGKLDNKALLFVYTTSPKDVYNQSLEDSQAMETYQNESTNGTRQGPIRRLISFVLSLFSNTGNTNSSTNTGSTGIGSDTGETPGMGPISGTETEEDSGISEEENNQLPPPIPPAVSETESNEMVPPPVPTPEIVGESETDQMNQPTLSEDEPAYFASQNNTGILPPLQNVSTTDNASNTDNESMSEEDNGTGENMNEANSGQNVVSNPLLPKGTPNDANNNQSGKNTMPVVGNTGTNNTTNRGNTGMSNTNTNNTNTGETVIPYEQVKPVSEYDEHDLTLDELTEILSQRGYEITVVPF